MYRLNRYDCPEGFVIVANGRPFQAMRKEPTAEKLRQGLCGNEYWLASTDGKLDPLMLEFLVRNFSFELDAEWRNRGLP